MASPNKNGKRMLFREEAEARGFKRMKSKATPAEKFDEQVPVENEAIVPAANLQQNAAEGEAIFIPANLMKATSLDGTNVEVVQHPHPGSDDIAAVSGELEAAAQNVTLYLKPARPKRGEGDYTSNLFFPPGVPAELKNQIYRYLVVFPHPITIAELGSVVWKHYVRHLEDCTHATGGNYASQKFRTENGEDKYHPKELPQGNRTKYIGRRHHLDIVDGFCVDPYTKKRTMIEVPDTVLSHRLICKQVNNEIAPIFWQENRFAFLDAPDMFKKLGGLNQNAQSVHLKYSQLAFNSGHSEQIRNIQHVNLQFSPKQSYLFTQCAPLLANVRVLRTTLSHDCNLLTFGMTALKGQSKKPLSMARGINTFAEAFSKISGPCKQLRSVELVGTDLIEVLTINEDEWYFEKVDINHPEAIGPIIRKNIFEVDGPWVSAENFKKRKEEGARQKKEEQEAQEKEAQRVADETLRKDIKDRAMAKLLEKRKTTEKLAKEKLDKEKRKAIREKAKKRGMTDVQISQANLQWQVLGRGDQRYLGAPSFPNNNFVGPISVPRPSVLYAHWLAMNGNTPPASPPPPNHKDTPMLSDLKKFLIANSFQRRLQRIQPRPAPMALHVQPHGGQAQQNQSQNGQGGHGLKTYGVQSQPLQGQQLYGQNVQARHNGAHHGEGVGFRTPGVQGQPFNGQPLDNHGLHLQGYQAQGFHPQPNYGQNSQAQQYQAAYDQADYSLTDNNCTAFPTQNAMNNGSINGTAMMNDPYGQDLFRAPAITRPGSAGQYHLLGMTDPQNSRRTQRFRGSLRAPSNGLPSPAIQHRPHGMMAPLLNERQNSAPNKFTAPAHTQPGLAGQHHPSGMHAPNNKCLTRLGQSSVTGPISPRPAPAGQDYHGYLENAPISNGLFSNHRFGTALATPSPAPAGTGFGGDPPNAPNGYGSFSTRRSDIDSSQDFSGGPSNAPHGYGLFSARRYGTYPCQGFGDNNNSGASHHQG